MKDLLEQEDLVTTEEQADLANDNGCVEDQFEEERPPERIMGAQSSQIALRIMSFILLHVSEKKLGKSFGTDCGYQLQGDDGKKTRFPDGSFVARGRLDGDHTPEGYLKLAPDFVLEVVSPNDAAYEIEEKRVAYLRAGVRLLWIVYPPTRIVFVFRAGNAVSVLGEADSVSGEDVLPDFTCSIGRFFEDL